MSEIKSRAVVIRKLHTGYKGIVLEYDLSLVVVCLLRQPFLIY